MLAVPKTYGIFDADGTRAENKASRMLAVRRWPVSSMLAVMASRAGIERPAALRVRSRGRSWRSRRRMGLKSAALAWAAAFPGEQTEEGRGLRTLWTNPRPDAEIATIDLVYGPQGNRLGTPALLAITAGMEAR